MHKPVVEVDTTIAAPAAEVWKAMCRGAMFPGTVVETDWKIGHPIAFKGEWNGKLFTDRGEIQTLSEAKELSFTHWSDTDGSGKRPLSYHLVKYRLEPSGRRTKVTLSQFNEGKETQVDAKTRAEFEKNWAVMLEGLKQTAEGMH
ncbi:MAG TPA: SRPBCC family protein [Devosia sp.]|jgi:uncharacterized protein YndB with AHSA1/START domain|uniref:SRPBCC family protein n=1 Tax=Devosia sp. TaxID=1871048 RepID=UPI002DDCD27E|nr:SRPBCC family protein [Devosia sp.]HEV2515138.1 SRPBCC family protein [Devosia sp.]